MIGTADDIRRLQRVEQGCPDAVVLRAITRANVIIQEMIGAANYATLDALPVTAPEIAGGIVNGELVEGIITLVSEMTFAMLATENAVITGFGTVVKKDEFSEGVDFFWEGKAKEANFRQGLRRLCELKGWSYHPPDSNFYTTKFFSNGKYGNR